MQRPDTRPPSPAPAIPISVLAVVLVCGVLAGCGGPAGSQGPPRLPAALATTNARINSGDIPRFAANSPFEVEYENPIPKPAKRLWARSCLWEKAPELVVEKWLASPPQTDGKYVLIEFWATWCSQCRRAAGLLNRLAEKYEDELVVIGITDEPEQRVRDFDKVKLAYHIAIDTKARMKKDLAVVGIPHVIIVEPSGYVVWEGFPLLKGHELTDEVVERILAAGRKSGREGPSSAVPAPSSAEGPVW